MLLHVQDNVTCTQNAHSNFEISYSHAHISNLPLRKITRQRNYSCFALKNGSTARRNSFSKSWHEKRFTDDLERRYNGIFFISFHFNIKQL